MRCFIALVPPDNFIGAAAAYLETAGTYGNWRWVRPEGVHITLAFLGDVDAATVDVARSAVASMDGRMRAPALRFGQAEAFPNPRRPRALVLRPTEGHVDAEDVWNALNDELAARAGNAGLPPPNPDWIDGRIWHPHLTLARPKKPDAEVPDLAETPADLRALVRFDRVVLFESLLGQGGSRYRAVETAMLEC